MSKMSSGKQESLKQPQAEEKVGNCGRRRLCMQDENKSAVISLLQKTKVGCSSVRLPS